MSGRHVLALTNSNKAADIITKAALEDFPDSVQRRLVTSDGYGLCEEISVDEDDYQRWVGEP